MRDFKPHAASVSLLPQHRSFRKFEERARFVALSVYLPPFPIFWSSLLSSLSRPTLFPCTHTHTHTMSSQPSHTLMGSPPPPTRPRASTSANLPMLSPASGFFSTPHPHTYVPFHFGVEFEMILGLKADDSQAPDPDATVSQLGKLHLKFCEDVARILTSHGMPCNYFDLGDGDQPDYSKWNAMIDSSLSKKHMRAGFCKLIIRHGKLRTCANNLSLSSY